MPLDKQCHIIIIIIIIISLLLFLYYLQYHYYIYIYIYICIYIYIYIYVPKDGVSALPAAAEVFGEESAPRRPRRHSGGIALSYHIEFQLIVSCLLEFPANASRVLRILATLRQGCWHPK